VQRSAPTCEEWRSEVRKEPNPLALVRLRGTSSLTPPRPLPPTRAAIREYDGKAMMARLLPGYVPGGAGAAASAGLALPTHLLQVSMPVGGASAVDWASLAGSAPWVISTKLVVKPDQLIKRRGKGGLLALNVDWPTAVAWISERMGKEVNVEGVSGVLTHFLVEPFVPHAQEDEYYVCINSTREGEGEFAERQTLALAGTH